MNLAAMDIETALNDVEGDMLLLDLAIKNVFEDGPAKRDGDAQVFRLSRGEVLAITHACVRASTSVQELERVFYARIRDVREG